MWQYIDVSKIVNTLPENNDWSLHSTNYFSHPEIKIELPICVANDHSLESGQTKIVQPCTILHDTPSSHYLEFKGIETNIGVYTISGVLKNTFTGYFYVITYNSSTQSRFIPSGTRIGSMFIKKITTLLNRE